MSKSVLAVPAKAAPGLGVQAHESLRVCEFPGRLHVVALCNGQGRNITAEVAAAFALSLDEHLAIAIAAPPENGVYTPLDTETLTPLSLLMLLMQHTDSRDVTYVDLREECEKAGIA